MTEQELLEKKNYEIDRNIRENLIKQALNIPFENNSNLIKPSSVNATMEFYKEHFSEYGRYCVLPSKKYVMAEFWFNDAGFQFKWRNHKMIIQLECLTWSEVYKRLKCQ